MSTYGRSVSSLGSQRNLPVTSASGLSELVSIAYTGTTANTVSRVSTTRRVHTKDRGGAVGDRGDLLPELELRMAPPRPGRDRQIAGGDQQQEEQQQYG